MLGKRLDYQVEENKIHFFFEKEEAFLEVITESIMNVFVPYETKGHRSKAIEGEKAVRTDFEVKDCGSYVSVATKQLEARVYDGFYVDFYRDGKSICEDYRSGRILRPLLSEKSLEVLKAEGHDVSAGASGSYPVQTVKKMDGDEKFYGLGDKTGFLNKRDYEYENWNSDIPQAHTDSYRALYKSIPFLINLEKYMEVEQHEWITSRVEPTCTEYGYTKEQCAICSQTKYHDYTEPIGHEWNNGEVIKKPSYGEEGVLRFYCKKCNDYYDRSSCVISSRYAI